MSAPPVTPRRRSLLMTASLSIPNEDLQFSPTSPSSNDPFYLKRYIIAQDKDNILDRVLSAIREGHRKPQPSTWMWFVFPQMNYCKTAWRGPNKPDKWPLDHFLSNLDEARALLCHPVLGPRLRDAAQTLLDSPQVDKFTVMDNMFYDVGRLHSSLTIFHQAARYPLCIHRRAASMGENIVFRKALQKYFPKELDSDDEDYRSEEEDCDVRPRVGTRHKPTLRRLVAMEMGPLQNRLESDDSGCVCGQPKHTLAALDRGILKKVAKKRAEEHVKNLKTFENERLVLAKNMEKEDEMIAAALNAYQQELERDVAEGFSNPWAPLSSEFMDDREYWAMFAERLAKEATDTTWALVRLSCQRRREEEATAAVAGKDSGVDDPVSDQVNEPAVDDLDSDAMSASTFG